MRGDVTFLNHSDGMTMCTEGKEMWTKIFQTWLITILCWVNTGMAEPSLAPNLRYVNKYSIVAPYNLNVEIPFTNSDGTYNAVIEIPAGTTAKWEVSKITGHLEWIFEGMQPREIRYLAYPANYGLIPQTLLKKSLGGDGDPLDVVVLGDSVPIGSVLRVKILGSLKLRDEGETDDKIIAARQGSHFSMFNSLDEFARAYPGLLDIIEIWFENYKGLGRVKSDGFEPSSVAVRKLEAAHEAFKGADNAPGG